MAKEFVREIKGHKYKYLVYWDRVEKKPKQKYLGRLGRVATEKTEKPVILRTPTEKETAEAIMKIGGGLIERKHLDKWIKRLKVKENMDMLREICLSNNDFNYCNELQGCGRWEVSCSFV